MTTTTLLHSSRSPAPDRPRQALPRRVLLILQSAANGGMETHSVDAAAELSQRGVDVLAVVPEWPRFDQLAERFLNAGMRVERLDTDARGGRQAQLRRFWRLLWLLRRFRPDVVHLQTPGATGGLATLLAARLATTARIIVTEHEVPSASASGWDHRARRAMDRLSHTTLAVSRRNAALRTKRLGTAPQQFGVILNGVPLPGTPALERAANRRTIRQQFGIAANAVVIGSLVRLVEGKGLDDLLRAFAIARLQQPCELLLVGEGPLREELVALAEQLGISDHLHLAGHQVVPARLLDALDVFVLAVPAGSMSIALLEAMAHGVASVITFCGPEEAIIHDETGLSAPANDAQGLARILVRTVEDSPLRTRLSFAAVEHIRRHFSVQRVVDDLLEVYAPRSDSLALRLRADGPANPRPGDRLAA